MEALLLTAQIASQSMQGVFKKKLNEKCRDCEISLSAMISLFALALYAFLATNISFSIEIVPYSIVFGVCYATAASTYVLALASGSLALTELMVVYSITVPLAYSFIFCGDTLNIAQIFGLIFLAISFFFTYYKPKSTPKKQTKLVKWTIFATLLFFSNGACGVVKQMQQRVFEGRHDNSFILLSLIIAVVLLAIIAVIKEKHRVLFAIKNGSLLSGMCGACNGAMNYFSMLCLLVVPGAIYYPLTAAGSLVLTCILSAVIYKEKFKRNQIIGFILAALSIVLINIK